jgi:uncharacterized membrane protein
MKSPRAACVVLFVCALFFVRPSHAAVALQNGRMVLEAESFRGKEAAVFVDARASGKKCAVVKLASPGALFAAQPDLPAGDYTVTAWVEAVPVSIIHTLAVQFRAGTAARTLDAFQFDAAPGYRAFTLRVFHPGGKLAIALDASGKTGFPEMRAEASEDESSAIKQLKVDDLGGAKPKGADDLLDREPAELLDGAPDVASLKPFDLRVLCDRVEIEQRRAPAAAVVAVNVDKIHYRPGEMVKAVATLAGMGAGGAFEFVARERSEADTERVVFRSAVTLAAGVSQNVAFEFKPGAEEFGRELRCALEASGREVHSAGEFFGVSRNVYRVGISGASAGQDKRKLTAEEAGRIMDANKRAYANYFECFAWAPCDYSDMTPKTEIFFSGQTQYPGSISGFKNLLGEAHRRGVKAITYGKACAGGISGFNTYQRHPEFFGHGAAAGPACEAFSTYYLERMIANDYNLHAPKSQGGWQHWASIWTRFNHDPAVDFGADEIIRSSEMLGWDGVRWDGHFVGNQRRLIDRVNAKRADFAHGYNVAFANPGSKLFLPPDQKDFHDIARDHGLIMDESVREFSKFGDGVIRTFYDAINREADYVKRIGGLPLFIMFDVASAQDRHFNVLCGLAAGQRYTFATSPGDYPFGSLAKFLTRFSAFVWDDTARVANAAAHFQVAVGQGPKGVAPMWSQSVWLRKLPDSRQQVLVNLVNLPGYKAFRLRAQPPSTTLKQIAISAKIPANAKLARAFHVSPDLLDGIEELKTTTNGDSASIALPELKSWSIAVFEFAGANGALAWPAFPLTTPVEDAAAVFAEQELKKAHDAKVAADKAKAGVGATPAPAEPKLPHYADFARSYNIDLDAAKKLDRPEGLAIRRDGRLDVHNAHGVFNWLNPIESAVSLAGGGNYSASWVDRVGFRLGAGGCMEDFPDTFEALFANDLLVLDNIQAIDLGARRRAMIADFVRSGGALLCFGGSFNLSMGSDHNTALAELLPVRIARYRDLATAPAGFALAPKNAAFFGGKIDWAKAGAAFTVDTSPLKPDVEILATAGAHPAIVASRFGNGRVITFLINPHGDPAPGALPYWHSSEWPKILAACLNHLAQDARTVVAATEKKRVLDRKKPVPEELQLEAGDLDGKKLAQRLAESRVNMIDAANCRAAVSIALQQWSRINDIELVSGILDAAAPFMDKSFAPLGQELVRSDIELFRSVGYKVLGLAKNPADRRAIEKGLAEKETPLVREALLALGELGDTAAAPAIEDYLRRGSEKLLARSVLRRLGRKLELDESLRLHVEGLQRQITLRSGRKSAFDTLHGGVSFKLTAAQRRAGEAELRTIIRTEQNVRFDANYFINSLGALDENELNTFTKFLVQTENTSLGPLAYSVFSQLPADKAQSYRRQLASAKAPQLRMLAEN